ncbi:hypothetical protein BC831DRAFT_437643 [Entophlyctis helioformis]|nr:hypothetical protein BC831DRAFT_437643 [Entophlyctis helioformis]
MTSAKRESVWDYPRPPAIEPTARHLRVVLDGVVIADTTSAHRILETSHPPTYYIPLADINQAVLVKNSRQTFCEWKGTPATTTSGSATGRSRVAHGPTRHVNGIPAWFYANPTSKYAAIKNSVSFYADPFECYVDGERVQSQEGSFYGGWITSDIDGGPAASKVVLAQWAGDLFLTVALLGTQQHNDINDINDINAVHEHEPRWADPQCRAARCDASLHRREIAFHELQLAASEATVSKPSWNSNKTQAMSAGMAGWLVHTQASPSSTLDS